MFGADSSQDRDPNSNSGFPLLKLTLSDEGVLSKSMGSVPLLASNFEGCFLGVLNPDVSNTLTSEQEP